MKDRSTPLEINVAHHHKTISSEAHEVKSQSELDAYYDDTPHKTRHFIMAAILSFLGFSIFILFILWLIFRVIL